MAEVELLKKRARPNLSLAHLEQQRTGASTPGWLAKTRPRSGASTPASDSPESNASSKENKVPAGRGRQAGKKRVAKTDAAAPEGEPAGSKPAQQPARRAKSADGRQKQAQAAEARQVAKPGRKSAPAKANKSAQAKQAAEPAAGSPAASEGSKGRKQSARARKSALPAQKAAGQSPGGDTAAAETPAEEPGRKGRAMKGRVTKKRAPAEQEQPLEKAAKRRRTTAEAAPDRAAEQPPERAAEPRPAVADVRQDDDADAAAAPAAEAPKRPASSGGAGAASPAALQPADQAAPRVAETAERPAAAAAASADAGNGASQADPVASTPGSDLARRVDANISALQADYAKLQAAYQALKRQSAAAAALVAVAPAAPALPTDSFLKLQAAHEELLQRYKELKAKKMEGLQDVLAAQAAQVEEHRAAANKVAEHWKAEAARHEAAAAAAQATQMQAEMEALRGGRQRLTEQVLDLKAGVAERDSCIAQLQHQLACAQLAAQTAEAARAGAETAAAELQQAAEGAREQRAAAAVVQDVVAQLAESAAAQQAGDANVQLADAADAAMGDAETAQAACSEGSGQATASPAAEAPAPQPPLPTPFHLKEARAMCPEGLSVSDAYNQPAASSSRHSGLVHMQTADRPLVPYMKGASHEQAASGATAEGSHATLQTPGPGVAAAVDASPSPAPCVPLPGVGGATPSNASLPVRQLQFASAARCAARPVAAEAAQAPVAETTRAVALPGVQGNPLQILTGFESSPFKNGGFLFEHRSSGYTFRLMPQADDGAPADAAAAGELWYKPYTLGELYDDMPDFLRSEMIISTDQRLNLVKLIADALARHTGADSLGAAK